MSVKPEDVKDEPSIEELVAKTKLSFAAILGPAGSGKSTLLKKRGDENPRYAKLTATTGIAAINLGLGVCTINSAFRFFNLKDAQEKLDNWDLVREFLDLAKAGFGYVAIDECSMLSAELLDVIVIAALRAEVWVEEINSRKKPGERLLQAVGILLMGDFLQLPPIDGEFCFLSQFFHLFRRELMVLTENYRQLDERFKKALNLLRSGKGGLAAEYLKQAGVQFTEAIDMDFDGITLFTRKDEVAVMNEAKFKQIEQPIVTVESFRWGRQEPEWTADIPKTLELKLGAKVMILANETKNFTYVNGDYGIVRSIQGGTVEVEVQRLNREPYKVAISRVLRTKLSKDAPEGCEPWEGILVSFGALESDRNRPDVVIMRQEDFKQIDDEVVGSYRFVFWNEYNNYARERRESGCPYWDVWAEKWVIGWIEYMPLRLGYASTIHKSQGLTFERVQVEAKNSLASKPSIMYVAITRCRTPEGLHIASGGLHNFSRKVQTADKVMQWV